MEITANWDGFIGALMGESSINWESIKKKFRDDMR
jgi:hypothetical protein